MRIQLLRWGCVVLLLWLAVLAFASVAGGAATGRSMVAANVPLAHHASNSLPSTAPASDPAARQQPERHRLVRRFLGIARARNHLRESYNRAVAYSLSMWYRPLRLVMIRLLVACQDSMEQKLFVIISTAIRKIFVPPSAHTAPNPQADAAAARQVSNAQGAVLRRRQLILNTANRTAPGSATGHQHIPRRSNFDNAATFPDSHNVHARRDNGSSQGKSSGIFQTDPIPVTERAEPIPVARWKSLNYTRGILERMGINREVQDFVTQTLLNPRQWLPDRPRILNLGVRPVVLNADAAAIEAAAKAAIASDQSPITSALYWRILSYNKVGRFVTEMATNLSSSIITQKPKVLAEVFTQNIFTAILYQLQGLPSDTPRIPFSDIITRSNQLDLDKVQRISQAVAMNVKQIAARHTRLSTAEREALRAVVKPTPPAAADTVKVKESGRLAQLASKNLTDRSLRARLRRQWYKGRARLNHTVVSARYKVANFAAGNIMGLLSSNIRAVIYLYLGTECERLADIVVENMQQSIDMVDDQCPSVYGTMEPPLRPRPKQNFLTRWAQQLGLSVGQDDANNNEPEENRDEEPLPIMPIMPMDETQRTSVFAYVQARIFDVGRDTYCTARRGMGRWIIRHGHPFVIHTLAQTLHTIVPDLSKLIDKALFDIISDTFYKSQDIVAIFLSVINRYLLRMKRS